MDDLLALVDRWEQLWLTMDDPADRAEWAAERCAELQVAAGRMADLRARGVAELHVDGWSFTRIAREALGGASGASRSLAQKLVARGREVVPPR